MLHKILIPARKITWNTHLFFGMSSAPSTDAVPTMVFDAAMMNLRVRIFVLLHKILIPAGTLGTLMHNTPVFANIQTIQRCAAHMFHLRVKVYVMLHKILIPAGKITCNTHLFFGLSSAPSTDAVPTAAFDAGMPHFWVLRLQNLDTCRKITCKVHVSLSLSLAPSKNSSQKAISITLVD